MLFVVYFLCFLMIIAVVIAMATIPTTAAAMA